MNDRTPEGTLADRPPHLREPRLQRVVLRTAQPGDFADIVLLHRRWQPEIPEWGAPQFLGHCARFPEGQLVAEAEGRIVGFASSLVVQWDDYGPDATWRRITGDGTFSTHDPMGRTLFVARSVAQAGQRHEPIARGLRRALRGLCRIAGLRRIMIPCGLPGYRRLSDVMTPELYAMRVAWRDIVDAELSPHLSRGYRYCGIIHNFLPEDLDSCGHAALLVWPNPAYRLQPPRRRPMKHFEAVGPSSPALAR